MALLAGVFFLGEYAELEYMSQRIKKKQQHVLCIGGYVVVIICNKCNIMSESAKPVFSRFAGLEKLLFYLLKLPFYLLKLLFYLLKTTFLLIFYVKTTFLLIKTTLQIR